MQTEIPKMRTFRRNVYAGGLDTLPARSSSEMREFLQRRGGEDRGSEEGEGDGEGERGLRRALGRGRWRGKEREMAREREKLKATANSSLVQMRYYEKTHDIFNFKCILGLVKSLT